MPIPLKKLTKIELILHRNEDLSKVEQKFVLLMSPNMDKIFVSIKSSWLGRNRENIRSRQIGTLYSVDVTSKG